MGRLTKLTSHVQTTLVAALSEGASIPHACEYAGIQPQTYYNWMRRSAAGEAEFAEFAESMTRARGRGVLTDLLAISDAVRAHDWRAAAWRLQHRYPQDYGAKLKISGDPDHPLLPLRDLPQEQLEAKITQLLHQCGYTGGPAALPAPTLDTAPEDLR